MAVKTYDPKKVMVVFGAFAITGFAEGNFISVESQGDGITAIVGCDQEVVRTIPPDAILKNIKISLLQSSASNDKLSLIYDTDNQTGAGVMPLAIKDLSGRSLLVTDQAWIVKKPVLQRGKSASDGTCEWTFQAVVADEAFFIGGHS